MSESVSPNIIDQNEQRLEESLRPQSFDEVVGREREKRNLHVMIESAKKRNKALDHILFHGPPGLGKTSLAMVVAKEMGVGMRVTSGPAISKSGDLAAILTGLEANSILFIDEVHRLQRTAEEVLYPVMEDNRLDIVLGKGPGAKTLRLDLPPITIIGATTRLAELTAPLRDRFGLDLRLDFYNQEELSLIVLQKSQKMGVAITKAAAQLIAGRARMTARVAVRILKRARDLAVVEGKDEIDEAVVQATLGLLRIDEAGLDANDRRILSALMYKFGQKPVGLGTLAASVSEDQSTLEDVYEPFLMRMGFLQRTPKGRILSASGIEYTINHVSADEINKD